jgi:hypothetical protein
MKLREFRPGHGEDRAEVGDRQEIRPWAVYRWRCILSLYAHDHGTEYIVLDVLER